MSGACNGITGNVPETVGGPRKQIGKMNNTVNVSIAGVAFVLDAEGYALLKDYLVRIEVGYKGNPDGAEILSDIEARISELILNEQSADAVVATERIRSIISQLGYPEGLDAGAQTENCTKENASSGESISRRLYRNPDGARLGGVCNGLATYFNVEPTMVRLLFCSPLLICVCISVIPFVNGLCGFFGTLIGVSFLLYFILWFAIPKARTPRQRLEMTGERITASSIGRTINRDLDDAKPSPRNERSASVFSELLFVVGRVLLFCIKAFVLVVGGVLTLGVIAMIVGAVSFLVGGGVFGGIHSQGIVWMVVLGLLLFILPVVILVYLMLKLVFNLPGRRTTLSVLFGIWVLVLVYVGVYAVRNHDRIADFFRYHDFEWVFSRYSARYDPAPNTIPAPGGNDGLIEKRSVTFDGTDTLAVQTVWLDEKNGDTVRLEKVEYLDSGERDTTSVDYRWQADNRQ